jgi:hypothetical protein
MDADRGLGDQGSAEIKTGSGERRRMRPLCGSPLHVVVRLLLAPLRCKERRRKHSMRSEKRLALCGRADARAEKVRTREKGRRVVRLVLDERGKRRVDPSAPQTTTASSALDVVWKGKSSALLDPETRSLIFLEHLHRLVTDGLEGRYSPCLERPSPAVFSMLQHHPEDEGAH